MKVLLLLAGQSRRFWPLSDKMLFPLCGKTLLEHQVERLTEAGHTDIILVVNASNTERTHALFPSLPIVEQEEGTIGMRFALLKALPLCGKESVLIAGGSDLVEARAYASLTERLTQAKADAVLLAKEVTRYFPGGYLTLEGERVTGVSEKPGEGNEPSNLVNIVAHLHKDASRLLSLLTEITSKNDDAYERALSRMCAEGAVVAQPYTGRWVPIKYPWHLLASLPLVLPTAKEPQIHPSAKIHKSAVIEGNVIIEEGARILPFACIMGPCFIGKRTIVGNSTLVRGSSIGDDCVIGFGTEVKGSVVARNVWTHSTYIGDSIVGENVSFGAGSVTGNLRLDEGEITSTLGEEKLSTGLTKLGAVIGDHCRIGIHSGFSPGVKVGKGSFIGSGVVLPRDIPDRSFVSLKGGEIQIRENRTEILSPETRAQYLSQIEEKNG